MKEKYLTGRWEISCLIINLIIYKAFTDAPRRFLESGTSAFLSALISAAVCYAVIWFLPVLYKKTGARNIFGLTESSPLLSVLSGAVIIIWLVFSSSYALEALVTFSKIAAFPSAPFAFTALFFVLATVAAVTRGMEAAVRPHAFIVPYAVFMILFMLLAVVGKFDTTNLFPIFGKGAEKTVICGLKNLSFFFDFVLVFLINPFFKDEKTLAKTVRLSGAVGILVNLLIILVLNLVIPYPASGEIEFPVYHIMKSAYFGRFFHRIDAFYLLSVALSGMAYLSFAAFLMTYSFKQAFGTQKSRPLIWSFAFIILFAAMLIHKKEASSFYNIYMVSEALGILIIILAPLFKRRVKE